MFMRATVALLFGGFLLVACPAAEAGWGLPDLNPFSSDKQSDRGSWSLPKLPGFGGKSGREGGKSMLTKTKETLFPWTQPSSAPPKITGTRRVYQPKSTFMGEQPESKQSFFSSWFESSQPKSKRPIAPHQWLGRPMPD